MVIFEYCLFFASWRMIFEVILEVDPIMNKLIIISLWIFYREDMPDMIN